MGSKVVAGNGAARRVAFRGAQGVRAARGADGDGAAGEELVERGRESAVAFGMDGGEVVDGGEVGDATGDPGLGAGGAGRGDGDGAEHDGEEEGEQELDGGEARRVAEMRHAGSLAQRARGGNAAVFPPEAGNGKMGWTAAGGKR